MCLGMPGQVVRVAGDTAIVDLWGTEKEVRLDLLEDTLLPGDYVITHEGCAVRRIPDDEVADTFTLYETVLVEA
ncbi:MAG: HypC/HybG/HupF family hydrogenase formation chaperone [Acidobacteria bacterium]|nr:MAG: HypC/HybG/HupF family hydrogenase formation chaperone [Acidobacteriota bacterium]